MSSEIQVEVVDYGIQGGESRKTYSSAIALEGDSKGWAWYRIREWWFDAKPLRNISELDVYSTHLLVLKTARDYQVILPVSSQAALIYLTRSEHGSSALDVHIRAARSEGGSACVITAQSANVEDLTSLFEAAVREARRWISGRDVPDSFVLPPAGPFDGVGFCTWTSLGEDTRITKDNLSHLVKSLATAKIPVQTFIIDDGWQHQKTYAEGNLPSGFRQSTGPEDQRGLWTLRGLWSFDAHPGLGDGGLEQAVRYVKHSFGAVAGTRPTIEVGVWMALNGGYWNGIHPNSPLIAKYDCKPFVRSTINNPINPSDETPGPPPGAHPHMILPSIEKAEAFWEDWFLSLRSQGITFVKVDNQGSLVSLDGPSGIQEWFKLWRSMVRSAHKVFGPGRVIHCMAHNEATFAGPQGLGVEESIRFVWRNSDDFGMEHKRPAAHQEHIQTNLFNALVSAHLGVIADADMFATAEKAPVPHAMLRALFPGPLLLTDTPGKHDLDLLSKMIARNRNGVVRPVRVRSPILPLSGRIMDTSILDKADGTGLWAGINLGERAIIAVWNTRGDQTHASVVVDTLHCEDVHDIIGQFDAEWLLTRMDMGRPMDATIITPTSKGGVCDVRLSYLGVGAFWLAQIHCLGNQRLAVLGIMDQLAGPVAIRDDRYGRSSIAITIDVVGTVGIWSTSKSIRATIDDSEVPVTARRLPTVADAPIGGFLLEIQVGNVAGDSVEFEQHTDGLGWELSLYLDGPQDLERTPV